jgi:hypothetical protein
MYGAVGKNGKGLHSVRVDVRFGQDLAWMKSVTVMEGEAWQAYG